MSQKVLKWILVWRLYLCLLIFLASFTLPFFKTFTPYNNEEFKKTGYVFDVLGNFDGIHYMQIAERGYYRLEQPFLPLYPFLIKLGAVIFRIPYILSSQLVSLISIFLGLVVSIKLLRVDKLIKESKLFLLIVFSFPTAFYFAASYNDALFYFLATLTLYFIRKKFYFRAILITMFSVITRFNGFALIFPFVIEYYKQYKKLTYLIIIPFMSFAAYLFYVQQKFGDWYLVFSTMKVWNQDKIVFLPQIFWRYFKMVFLHPSFNQLNYYVAVFELVFVIFYIYLIIYSYRKIRFSYWVFLVVSLLIPSLTGTFQGMPRYGLHLYPLFLVLTMIIGNWNKRAKIIYFAVSLLLQFVFLAIYTRGYFIA